jgi:hypothetical protein
MAGLHAGDVSQSLGSMLRADLLLGGKDHPAWL